MRKRVLVALGGNAISTHKERGTAEEQFENVRTACRHLVGLIKDGYQIAVAHGNGPQVGDILLKNELTREALPPMPLDVCGAQSQGMIGYMLQQSMRNQLKKASLSLEVVSLLTQTVVDKNDLAFDKPTKPIGPYYELSEAEDLREKKGWLMIEDSGRGYRRVVPSPEPLTIVERTAIRMLVERGVVVIAVGGGGVPVILESGLIKGVEAVIDKDLGAQVFANEIRAEVLLMLTDVAKVSLHYGEPTQFDLDEMTTSEAKGYLRQGHFAPGSMGPKVEAAVRFVHKGGKRAIITSLNKAGKALRDTRVGTIIH